MSISSRIYAATLSKITAPITGNHGSNADGKPQAHRGGFVLTPMTRGAGACLVLLGCGGLRRVLAGAEPPWQADRRRDAEPEQLLTADILDG